MNHFGERAKEEKAALPTLFFYCEVSRYGLRYRMIESFAHKGLKALFLDDDPRGVRRDQIERVLTILTFLNDVETLEDLNIPSLRLHQLQGKLKGHYAVTVNKNWRITFRIAGQSIHDVNLIDYH